MKQRITLYTFLLSGFFLLLSTSETKASHIMGGDITYNCIAPNTFAFTAQFYRDCNGITLPNTVSLTVYSPSGCGPSQNITLELIPAGPQTVTPLCPGELDACNTTAGQYGIQKYVYTHVPASQGSGLSDPPVVLSTGCTDWTVWWSSCCRNTTITTGPANDGFYIETVLNNIDAPCNNSPTFLNTPTPYACIGETVNYSHGVSEWDGDSLVFSLIPCLEGNAPGNSVGYNNPYSGINPISSSTGVTIDSQTGAITFTPNIQQVGVICVLVEEYRNGTKVGHVMRDIQFTVLPCSNSLPLASGANGGVESGGATGDYNIQVCEGELINFTIETFDSLSAGQVTGNNIDLSWNGGINNPNASFTVFDNNTDSSSALFRWPTTKNDAGFYIFTVNLQDDACPINGVNIFTFSITIDDVPDVDAGGYQIACNASDTLTLNAVANVLDLSYQWQTASGTGIVSDPTILTPDVPPATGTYKLVKTYQSGCVDSNVVAIDLSPGLQMPTIADANLCQGDSIQLDATVPVTANPPVTFTNNTVVPFGNAADTAISIIDVSNIQPGVFDVNMLQSVCIDISYPLTSFLTISLVSPNGTVIDLSSNNGGGSNYTSTCFEPNAATPITSGSNPFTGSFTPEGNLSMFNGDVVNGNWTLWVSTSTALPGLPNLQLNSWSMTFTDITDTMSYVWTPATDLSCTTCPDPWASPTTPTTYQVITTDFYSCTDTQDVFVDIISALMAPVVTCAQVTTTSLTFGWGSVTGATGYEVSTDNGATWIPANGTLQHQLTGLALGQSITILVRGISTCPGTPPSGTQTCTTTPCTLDASFVSSTDATCNAGTDGTADVTAIGGTPNYTYQIGTQPVQTTGSFTGLAAGNYVATVTDLNGCTDTVQVTITEPTAITFTTDSTLTNCNGGADGTAIVTAVGGTGTLTYQWDVNAANQTTDTATALAAGTYDVTITDASSCFTTGTVTVNEPPLIVLDSFTIDVSCNAAMDGSAKVLVQGGTSLFTYAWSANANGQTTDSIVGLSGGTYTVTVTDANGCTDNISMYVDEASAIVLSTSMTQATCNGFTDGSATVSAIGGTPSAMGTGYTYLWDANANNQTTATATSLTTGTYFVTVTDGAGCTAVTSATVTAPPSMTLTTISNSPSTTCSYSTDGTAVVTPSGGNGGYTYSWNQGINQVDSAVTGLPAGTSYVTVTDVLGCSEVDSVIIAGPAPVVANPTANPISCNGADDGSITLAPVGGTGALLFSWSSTATTQDIFGLAAGTYTVTITDANMCVFTDTATIIEPDTLQTTASMTVVSCLSGNDGTATALPLGGQLPYTYNWSSSSTDSIATILTAGTYTLTVTDAAGCTDTASIIVTQPATAVTSTITGTNLLCNNDGSGTATVIAADGTIGTGYTYLWDDINAQTTATATGLQAGTYNVTVTDGNGCTTTNSITLTEPVVLSGTTAATPASCFGETDGTVIITPNGGTTPYTYQWS
ncbi:MAG: proprotein convertase P-domain-containing protein, partial [Saprospiraceae bacterium]